MKSLSACALLVFLSPVIGQELPKDKPYQAAALPKVTLMDPGAEPRRVLRLTAPADGTQSARMKSRIQVSMKVPGADFPSPTMPWIVVDLTMKATERNASGDVTWTMKVDRVGTEDAGAPADMVAMVRSSIAPLKDLTGAGQTTDRGLTRFSSAQLPDDEGDSARELGQQVGQLGIPLPEEAVGIGARWSCKSTLHTQGLVVQQIATYELAELRSETAVVNLRTGQTAEPQAMNVPHLPAGITMLLESLKSSGTGRIELSLNRLLPDRLTNRVETDLSILVRGGEKPERRTQRVKVEVELLPVSPTPDGPETPKPDPTK